MSQNTRPDIRPFPTLKYEEIERELAKLTEDQRDAIEEACPEPWFATRSTAAMYYQEAIRRGWLVGPA
jgi:hypothetical protein